MPTSVHRPVAAQRQTLIKIQNVEGYWATKTGAATSSALSDVWDGGALTPEKTAEPAVTEDLVLSRPYRPGRDQDILRVLRPNVGRMRTTITEQEVDADLVPIGRPTVYANALLSKVVAPDTDAASSSPKMMELTFGIESVS